MLGRRLLVLIFAAIAAAADKPVDFDRDIRPILSDRCFACHGPDEKRRMANLRLDTEEGVSFAQSRMLARVSAGNASRMPPPQAGPPLTEPQIAAIRQWIAQGGKWERHWAFVPPQRPELPAVRDAQWPRNPIDRFVLARLEREGLKPSPEANRATLLRRLSFDLTGLPPTTAELDAFLADQSPDAYEKQVDRLLASPHYGERMAADWLDLARYADTHGYHIDSGRDMWKWRDWVIDAFNRNMPYDRFGIEQLAGDLLPHATTAQRLATAFNRNHEINFEAGAIPEEYRVEYVADRVDTTATVFMGLTLGCARCHDHKYDPIAQKDYYRFSAFFNGIAEKGLDGERGNAAPLLELPTAEQASQKAWLEQAIQEHKDAMPKEEIKGLLKEWRKDALPKIPQAPRDGLLAQYTFEGKADADWPGYSVALNGQAHLEFPVFHAERFAVAFWTRSGAFPEMTLLEGGPGFVIGVEASHPQPEYKRGSPLFVEWQGRRWRSQAIFIGGEWHHAALNFAGAQPALFLDGNAVAMEAAGSAVSRPAGPVRIGNWKGDLADLRFYGRVLSAKEAGLLTHQEPARFTLAQPKDKRSKTEKHRLKQYFLAYESEPDLRRAFVELRSLKRQLAELKQQIVTVQVMAEMARPRDTFVLARGDYRNRGPKVTAGVPSLLPPLPKDAPANRLGLAEWLFSPQHPLTARVAVNRYWQQCFGIGLVKTAEDFGSQGDAPIQRDLLDWLATEFQKNWDVKAIQRLIVTSATYRQSSQVSAEMLERDPENRLLARGARFRLPAEMVRDNALAVSGLLNGNIGGPSVFPYQEPGLWEELSRGEIYTAQEYRQSQGADLYRRSLYTFWKRTVPPPSLSTFDAPDREKCTARRLITNTPLQALVLMNDPTYLEAARALAQRAEREAPDPTDARIRWIFRAATGRLPNETETRVLADLLARGSWMIVASTVLNLDETITKE